MNGKLFIRDFLAEGITETEAWKAVGNDELEKLKAQVKEIFCGVRPGFSPNEATTESEIIFPILKSVGWANYLPQQNLSSKGRKNVPDALLFVDSEAKAKALTESSDNRRYRHGLAIVESKRWERPLDRGGSQDNNELDTPSSQLIMYLRRTAVMSDGAVRWGILTNGRYWRLYWEGARSLSEDFIEFDLPALVGVSGVQLGLLDVSLQNPVHYFKVFLLLFCKDSFLPQRYDIGRRTFHEIALEEGRHWEKRVSEDLGAVVFDQVFPNLVRALVENDPETPKEPDSNYLEDIRRAALTFLYRLLFIFYAEDRNLLPANDTRYDDYSLRKIREDIAVRIDSKDVFSNAAKRYNNHLNDLHIAIAEGDVSIGLPPYNGGLFEPDAQALLNRIFLSDAILAPMIDQLSRRVEKDEIPKWINYRDLSVQQLGSIYERLLEFAVIYESDSFAIRPNIFARKGSGSYYTHDDLVQLIIKETVGPLVAERTEAFDSLAIELKSVRKQKKARLAKLQELDPASRILDLKICDPAMGSGHFLVSLVDYLADRILESMASAAEKVDWTEKEHPYISPLAQRISFIRGKITDTAIREKWNIDFSQLDDRHIVRRMILKRVIYGVDKNEMAVELAKVALWLHTFTVGAPLSFLDHHLCCGDSLFGEWLETVNKEIETRGGLFQAGSLAAISAASGSMIRLSEITDADIAEVNESKSIFDMVVETLQPLRRLMDFWHSVRWLENSKQSKEEKKKLGKAVGALVIGKYGDPIKVVDRGNVESNNGNEVDLADSVNELLAKTRELAAREKFLHWEVAFPTVWKGLEKFHGAVGGFDAVIGNPPWDRMKLQEVEWFAERKPEIAKQSRAADRKKMIKELSRQNDPLWQDYQWAREVAETAMTLARGKGQYPLLSNGDVNIYSLFVEQAMRIIDTGGIVGLLTPSGIASDKSASEFFRMISTGGRLSTLYDFENKKVFFPDIHASFKFNILVFGGDKRKFPKTQCAFFLHSVSELETEGKQILLEPEDFSAVNPNTGTAPIFRTTHDGKITLGIYSRHPVFVDRRNGGEKKLWPVRYHTMFHMTNDSNLFKTKAEMEKEGYYPIGGNIWKKGDARCVPLYEGKMVQAYDHRAANIVTNPDNLHRPAQQEPASLEQHKDPKWQPNPQFWIHEHETDRPDDLQWIIGFKDVTAPTNMRTMIAAVIPWHGVGNTIPVYLPTDSNTGIVEYKNNAPLILANINSFAWDYISRQKVQGQHLNSYIIEQIPFIDPIAFKGTIGNWKIADFIREQVLRLTYTSVDMEPFARDMGYAGAPFTWDEQERRHIMARLDALFFHLYGVSRKDAEYILETFPIVWKKDEKQFGRYFTKELILAYMNAVAAGDLETKIII